MADIVLLLQSLAVLWVVCLGFSLVIQKHTPYLAWSGRLLHKLLALPFQLLAWATGQLATAVSPRPKKKKRRRR